MKPHPRNLLYALGLGLGLTIFAPLFLPWLTLSWLVPACVMTWYRRPLSMALWTALFCGAVLDLLNADARFGLHTLNYVVTTAAVYPLRRHFYEDSLATFPILTALFAAAGTLNFLVLSHVLDRGLPYSWAWCLTDVLVMPVADGVYCLLAVVLPLLYLQKRPERAASARPVRPQ